MSRPVGSASSTVVNFSEVESEPITPPPTKGAQRTESQVEPWSGQQATFTQAQFKGATTSGQDLAAQSARDASQRQEALKTLAGLEGPLAKLAEKFPNPNTQFKTKDVAFGAFGDAIHSEAFTRAASTLSASEVRTRVEEQVKKAWPQSTPQQAEKLKQYFMGQLCESLRERVAPRLQDLTTKMLEDASKSFFKTAVDPAEVQRLATRLTDMADPQADPGDQATVRDLRAAMGLDLEEKKVTPEALTVALCERAALLQQQSTKMKHHSRGVLFRELAAQEVGPLFKKEAGIREGSLLSAQIDQVKAQGEKETTRMGYVKLAALVTAGGLTGGLALGGAGASGLVVGVGGSLAMNAPSLLHAWEAVDTAKASESAGSMKAGAGEDANRRAQLETAAAAVSIAGATGINHALHGVLAESGDLVKVAAHAAVELGAELLSEEAVHAIDAKLSAKGEASGRNALERARP